MAFTFWRDEGWSSGGQPPLWQMAFDKETGVALYAENRNVPIEDISDRVKADDQRFTNEAWVEIDPFVALREYPQFASHINKIATTPEKPPATTSEDVW